MPRFGTILFLAAAGFMLYGYLNQADRDASGQLVSEGTVDVFDIRVGDCTNDDSSTDDEGADEFLSVKGVPCDQPHDNEFYSIFDINDENFPGEEAILEHANQTCIDNFEPFIGKNYDDSELEISFFYPTEESWAQQDREVACFLFHIDYEKLEGSMAGSGI